MNDEIFECLSRTDYNTALGEFQAKLEQSLKHKHSQLVMDYAIDVTTQIVPHEVSVSCFTCKKLSHPSMLEIDSNQNLKCQRCNPVISGRCLNKLELYCLNQAIVSGCPFNGCTKYNKRTKLQDYLKHLDSECKMIPKECPNLCEKLLLKSTQLVPLLAQEHFDVCSKSQVKCSECKMEITVEENRTHDCKGRLLKEIVRMHHEIKLLKQKQNKLGQKEILNG